MIRKNATRQISIIKKRNYPFNDNVFQFMIRDDDYKHTILEISYVLQDNSAVQVEKRMWKLENMKRFLIACQLIPICF